jgi:condensin complex subunit 3
MRIVVEIVQSLRRDSQLVTSDSEQSEREDEEDSSSEDEEGDGAGQKRKQKRKRSLGPEQLEQRKELDLRCLIVVKALLERVMSVSDRSQVVSLEASTDFASSIT